MMETCNKCSDLKKLYLDDDELRFNACCGRSIITFSNGERPRIIKHNTGHMLDVPCPTWCPKKRGVIKEYFNQSNCNNEEKQLCLPPPQKEEKVKLTYSERRERIMNLPKHLQWDDIKEDEIYVIPKILFQNRKVVRIVVKDDNLLKCCEIDEYGNESKALTSIYKKDIDTVFITKLLKF